MYLSRLIAQHVYAELMLVLKLLLEQKNMSLEQSFVFNQTLKHPFIQLEVSLHVVRVAAINPLFFLDSQMILLLLA